MDTIASIYTATYGVTVTTAPVVGQTLIVHDRFAGVGENLGTISAVETVVSPSGLPMYAVTAFGGRVVHFYR